MITGWELAIFAGVVFVGSFAAARVKHMWQQRNNPPAGPAQEQVEIASEPAGPAQEQVEIASEISMESQNEMNKEQSTNGNKAKENIPKNIISDIKDENPQFLNDEDVQSSDEWYTVSQIENQPTLQKKNPAFELSEYPIQADTTYKYQKKEEYMDQLISDITNIKEKLIDSEVKKPANKHEVYRVDTQIDTETKEVRFGLVKLSNASKKVNFTVYKTIKNGKLIDLKQAKSEGKKFKDIEYIRYPLNNEYVSIIPNANDYLMGIDYFASSTFEKSVIVTKSGKDFTIHGMKDDELLYCDNYKMEDDKINQNGVILLKPYQVEMIKGAVREFVAKENQAFDMGNFAKQDSSFTSQKNQTVPKEQKKVIVLYNKEISENAKNFIKQKYPTNMVVTYWDITRKDFNIQKVLTQYNTSHADLILDHNIADLTFQALRKTLEADVNKILYWINEDSTYSKYTRDNYNSWVWHKDNINFTLSQ
jgi:hypothetical protein